MNSSDRQDYAYLLGGVIAAVDTYGNFHVVKDDKVWVIQSSDNEGTYFWHDVASRPDHIVCNHVAGSPIKPPVGCCGTDIRITR